MQARRVIERPFKVTRQNFKAGVLYSSHFENLNWSGDYLVWINVGDKPEFGIKDGDLLCVCGAKTKLYWDNEKSWQFSKDDIFFPVIKTTTISTPYFCSSSWEFPPNKPFIYTYEVA